MKKRVLLITVCLLASTLMVSALAAGSFDDSLVSLSYLTEVFTKSVDQKVEEKLDASDALLSGGTAGSAPAVAKTWTETRLKSQDVLLGTTGTSVMVLAGNLQVSFPSGTVVDVTTGSTVASGTALAAKHRYLVAEDTSALFQVTSKTAVVDYQGSYSFSYSDAVDYNAIATALKTLHLFRGSDTGYGQGYDLEVAPTRIQALIMFIRVLGEENEALAYTGSHPFTDIVKGSQSDKYVGYAYAKGYTNGYSPTTFEPNLTIPANQYVEFALRAMGYSSTSGSPVSTSLERALASGVLTDGEYALLKTGTFLRADLAYISYYALDTQMAQGGQCLRDALLERGTFTAAEAREADRLVSSARIS